MAGLQILHGRHRVTRLDAVRDAVAVLDDDLQRAVRRLEVAITEPDLAVVRRVLRVADTGVAAVGLRVAAVGHHAGVDRDVVVTVVVGRGAASREASSGEDAGDDHGVRKQIRLVVHGMSDLSQGDGVVSPGATWVRQLPRSLTTSFFTGQLATSVIVF